MLILRLVIRCPTKTIRISNLWWCPTRDKGKILVSVSNAEEIKNSDIDKMNIEKTVNLKNTTIEPEPPIQQSRAKWLHTIMDPIILSLIIVSIILLIKLLSLSIQNIVNVWTVLASHSVIYQGVATLLFMVLQLFTNISKPKRKTSCDCKRYNKTEQFILKCICFQNLYVIIVCALVLLPP